MDPQDEARYSADLPRLGAAGPPGNPPVERVRDVLLITGDAGVDQGDADELILLPKWEGDPFAEDGWRYPGPIELGRSLSLQQLDRDEAELVLNACSPRGHFFVPVRQFGQMYSVVREVDETEVDEHRWAWNTGGLISDAVGISRLVLDNSYSYQYAARIFDHRGGEQHIMPAEVGADATYRVRKEERDWLTYAEAGELKELLAKYWAVEDELPERVAHAVWLSEYVVSVRWLDVIAPLLVVAFEALVNTSKQLVTRQFKERVPALTEEVGAPLSASLCEEMYDARSRWVHGSRVPLYQRPRKKGESWTGPTDAEQKAAVERVAKTQDSLRAVIRRCIEDEEFRAIFAEDESIRERWPVAV